MVIRDIATRRAGAAAGLAAAAALLAGCAGVSASPVGGNLDTPLPTLPGFGAGATTDPDTAAAAPTATAPATACTPQTASVSGDTAAQMVQVAVAEIPAACGFTLTGTLESPAEQADGAELQGSATYDRAGNAHFALLDQGLVLDTYVLGSDTYLRLYESATPTATPDPDVLTFWHPALSAASVATVGSSKWVKLTGAQKTSLHLTGSAGLPGYASLSSPTALAADLTDAGGEPWTIAGAKTVDGIPCTLITHVSKTTQTPKTTIAINKATGLPLAISYQQGTVITTASFTKWGTTPLVPGPTEVVDGATLS
ncbi:MAG TPA: hypothetical protein VGX23_10025 [Actinocrinis sp.]|nr:hypothetical protein [Actinocrinis sp.]